MKRKGKNFSANSKTRNLNDFYQTPYSMIWQLLETGELNNCKTILEPACGNNAIVSQLQKTNNFEIIGYDLFQNGVDFMQEKQQFDCIVTNPPFSYATEFILKAKKNALKKIIFLLPLNYLHGVNRFFKIWKDEFFPFKCVYIFTRYPLLEETVRSDGKYQTGMQVYAWFVWDKEWKGEPVIRWINNDKFVLKTGDVDCLISPANMNKIQLTLFEEI